MFEGLGVGSRLAFVRLPQKYNYMPILGAILYGITTPIGIAAGLGVRETYNPDSTTANIVSGVLDAFSSGILLYTGLVEVRGPHKFCAVAGSLMAVHPVDRARVLVQLGHAPRVELEAGVCARMHGARCWDHGVAWAVGIDTTCFLGSALARCFHSPMPSNYLRSLDAARVYPDYIIIITDLRLCTDILDEGGLFSDHVLF